MSILSYSTAGTADDRTTPIDTLVNTPELAWSGILLDLTDPTHPTTADDMYAFGVVAWEVRTDYSVRCLIDSLEIGSHGATTVLWDD